MNRHKKTENVLFLLRMKTKHETDWNEDDSEERRNKQSVAKQTTAMFFEHFKTLQKGPFLIFKN